MLRYIHESSYGLDGVRKVDKVKISAFSFRLFTSLVASKQICSVSFQLPPFPSQAKVLQPTWRMAGHSSCTSSPGSSRKC